MKKFELIIGLLLVPLDFLMITAAALAAYFLRFEGIVEAYRPAIFELDLFLFLSSVVPVILIWLVIFALSGLYTMGHPRKILTEIKKIVAACFLGFAIVTIVIFLRGELFNSRFIVLAGTVLAIVFVSAARILVRLMKFTFYKYQIGVRRIILVGSNAQTQAVARAIESTHRNGLVIVKSLHTIDAQTLNELEAQLGTLYPDMILQADVNLPREQAELLLDFARDHHLQFAYVADLFDTKVSNTEISTVGDIPLIEIKQTPLDGWGRIVKRLFDLTVGSLLCLISLPFMLLIAIAIKLDSKGPIIYKNQRVGKGKRIFNLLKFRRFKTEFNTGPQYDSTGEAEKLEQQLIEQSSERKGPIYKVLNDPRNTRVGRFLEKTSLDELPQFFNVLKGDMSLVGPRPHQPREVEGYKREHKRVFVAKPGITGLAQISGRSDLDYDEEARLDIFYIENWSLRADIAILLKTPLSLLRRHK